MSYVPTPPPPPPSHASDWDSPLVARIDAAEVHSLRTLSYVVITLISIVAALHLAAIPTDLAYLGSLQDMVDGDLSVVDDALAQEDLRSSFGVAILASLVVAGVAWIVWQRRARRVAEQLGAGGQRHSTALATFCWLIPFANLVLPKQVIDDLWRASDPDAPPALHVAGRRVWSGVHVWWGSWVLGAVLARVLLRADEPETFAELDGYLSSVRLELGATVLVVVSAVLAVRIVQRITARLVLRAERYGVSL